MNKTLRTALVLALFVCAGLLLIVPARAQSVPMCSFGPSGMVRRGRVGASRTTQVGMRAPVE